MKKNTIILLLIIIVIVAIIWSARDDVSEENSTGTINTNNVTTNTMPKAPTPI